MTPRHREWDAIEADAEAHARPVEQRRLLLDRDPRGVAWSRCPASGGRRHSFYPVQTGGDARCFYCCRLRSALEAAWRVAR